MLTKKIIKNLKLIFIILIVILSLPVTSFASDDIKEITILMPAPFADATNDLVTEFNSKYQGKVKLKTIRGPRDTESLSDLAISSMLLGETSFDALLVDVTWLPKYAETGWLLDLDKWIKNEELNLLAKGARLGNKYKDRLYRWPLVSSMGLLYWRTDLMDKPPETPFELIEISKNLIKEGKVKNGFSWQGRQYEGLSCVFLEVLEGFGGKWLDEDGNVGLNNPEALKAVNWMRTLIEEGVSPKSVTNFSEPEALQAFKQGQTAFMRNWPYAWSELQKTNSPVKGKVGISKNVAINGSMSTSTLGSWGFSMLKSTSNPEETMLAIKFLTNKDSQIQLFKKYGYTPTISDLFKNKELQELSPIISQLENALEVTKPRPMTPFYAQISDVLQRQISSVLTSNISIEKAMNVAQSNTYQILNSTGKKYD